MTLSSHLRPGQSAHDAATLDMWLWFAAAMAGCLLAAITYRSGVARLRRRLGRRWSPWRSASLLAGLVLIAAVTFPPLAALAHADVRVHMLQHLLLGMLAPLALVLSAPMTLLLGAVDSSTGRQVGVLLRSAPVHVLSHPAAAALIHVGALFVLYLTPLYALSHAHPAGQALVQWHFVAAGYLYAWSLVGPDPAPRRAGLGVRLAVLLAAAAAHAYLAKVLFAGAGQLPPGTGHPVAQAQAAAQLMYYGGDVVEILLLVALLSVWYRRRAPRSGGSRQLSGIAGH